MVLPTSFFTDLGFGSFKLTSTYGSTTVTAGTTLTLKQQNDLLAPGAGLPATGARVRDFASLGFALDGMRQAVNLTLTESAYNWGVAGDASATARLLIDQGASILADPLASITLNAGGPAVVLGSITAPGGSIAINQGFIPSFPLSHDSLPQYVWIGADARLDVAGSFVPNPRVTAYSTGSVLAGGSITLSSAGVMVALAGSVFDIAGASGTVEQPTVGLTGPRIFTQPVWSNGGILTLTESGTSKNAYHSVYFAGTIEAAGGAAQAAGGTLNVSSASGGIVVAQSGDVSAAFAGAQAPVTVAALAAATAFSNQSFASATSTAIAGSGTKSFTIQKNLPSGGIIVGSAVTVSDGAGDTMSGTVQSYDPSSGLLTVTVTHATGSGTHAAWTVAVADQSIFINADTINTAHSGLDTVSFTGPLYFSGNVALTVAGSILIDNELLATTLLPTGVTSAAYTAPACTSAGSCIPSIGHTNVTLEAGYIRFANGYNGTATPLPTLADGTLTLQASQAIDVVGMPTVDNAGTVNLVSGIDSAGRVNLGGGDIRLIGAYSVATSGGSSVPVGATSSGDGGLPWLGSLIVADNLNLSAREIYPTTDTAFLLMSLGLAPTGAAGTHNTISFASSGAAPVAPLSAGGAILVDAGTILQGGALLAPLGTIQLGFGSGQTLPAMFLSGTTSNPYNPVQLADGGIFKNQFSTTATASVTLLPGSLTSVSANGLSIPYGTTTDGTDWTDHGTLLNGPPSKLIVLGGGKVDTRAGAVIDGSGGGDVYATEFVSGTGGSRNVLTTATQTVYALVPGYGSALAAYDPSFTTAVAAGSTVTIAGGNGIAGGTYTLLPAQYATLPGAYRVVVVSTNASPLMRSAVTADGSIYVTGTLGNAINGSRSSQTALLQIQPNATWTRYSEIDIARGNGYFATLAANNGTAAPRLAQDAANIVVAAGTSLALNATNLFTPATGGLGGQLDITGANLVVAASDQLVNFGTVAGGVFTPTGSYGDPKNPYLFLDADMLSRLGIESVLIGGYRATTSAGTLITATALNLEIATDAAHPLTGPELLFTSLAPTAASSTVRGLVVDPGSVIAAQGTVSAGGAATLVIGVDPVAQYNSTGTFTGWSTGVSGDGALLRVSNGGLVDIVRNFVPGIYQAPSSSTATTPPTGPVSATVLGSLSVGAGVALSGNTLTLDSSGATTLAGSASLTARNYDLSGASVSLGDNPAGNSGGLVVTPDLIGKFAGADIVRLRSASVFYLYGSNSFGDAANPIGTLTLDGAGLTSDGGATSIAAGNIVLIDSQVNAKNPGGGGSGGSLALNAGKTLTFGAGTKKLSGFASITATAGSRVLFAGTGSLDAAAASVSLTAPLFLVAGATSQSLTTTGALSLMQGADPSPALDPTVIGGILALKGGSIGVTGTLAALGGTLTLEATTGDLVLSGNAVATAAGTRTTIGDLIQDTPAGNIRLYADVGNVTLGGSATVDVSGAGSGYAGTLSIYAGGTATLDGTLEGAARYNDLGGEFTLIAGQLATALPLTSGFTRSFTVSLAQGDISIGAGQTLTSERVLLVANTGGVFVDGTIDASAASGGTIGLYGAGSSTADAGTANASGVTIGADARLYARYQAADVNSPGYANGESTLVERGGTITLGTTGTPDRDANNVIMLNNAYGYENVSRSGAITVASGAVFDVSGGAGGKDIDNTGGSVVIRAPILTNNSINVAFKGAVVTNTKPDGSPSGAPIIVNAFAVWSTTDASTDPNKHFDGIIDPAGFFDATGKQIVFADGSGLYPTSTAASPAAGAYTPHVNFYQTTLLNFVEGFNLNLTVNGSPTSALHLRPEIDLVNPSTGINGGNITVASNWNFGAGSIDANGNINLLYRTSNGREPGTLTLRAVNNLKINASIADGFWGNFSAQVSETTTEQVTPTADFYYQQELATLAAAPYGSFDSAGNLIIVLADGSSSTYLNMLAPYIDPSRLGPATLQQPTEFQNPSNDPNVAKLIDQYTQYYSQYTQLFDVWARETNFDQAFYINSSSAATYTPPAAPTAGVIYYNFSLGAQPGVGTDYVSMYENYFIQTAVNLNQGSYDGVNFSSLAATDGCGTCVVYAAPFAPAAQLDAALQAGYKTSPSITVTTTKTVTLDLSVPQNAIANNPASYNGFAVYNTTSSANLMTAAVSGKGSFSYNFVGGALFNANGSSSVNPNAVVALFNGDGTSAINPNAVVQPSSPSSVVTGDVTVDGHTSYINSLTTSFGGTNSIIDVPTLVRTGTGSITITAARDFALLDPVAPGAVYTAGYAADNAAGFTAPTLPTLAVGKIGNGLITAPVWATGGGNLVVTAGRDIVGIETPVDPTGSQFVTGTSQGVSTGEFWSAWYYVNGNPAGGVPDSSWINYGTFFQGFGALAGGNITLQAGRNVRDVSASLPETIQVSGSQSAAITHDYGGGNLLVEAGNDVLSGVYYVGRGTGLIRAGGSVVSDATLDKTLAANFGSFKVPAITNSTAFSLPLLLAVQDGYVSVQAAGSIDLGGIFEPTRIPADLLRNMISGSTTQANVARTLPSAIGASFESYGPNSGVALASGSGSIAVNSLFQSNGNGPGYTDTLFTHAFFNSEYVGGAEPGSVIAPSLSVTALTGDITLANGDNQIVLAASASSGLSLIAGGSIIGSATNILTPTATVTGGVTMSSAGDEDQPVLIYAGEDISSGVYTLQKQARLWAGRDIANVAFVGTNNAEGDITSIVAGRDILATRIPDVLGQTRVSTRVSFTLYGPGDFVIEAGRNLGPFSTYDQATIIANPLSRFGGGIWAIGDGSQSGLAVNSSLPKQGADITLRYGVAKGIDYAAAIAKYGDAATAAASGIDFVSGIIPQLEQIVDQLIISQAKAAGIANPSVAVTLTPAQAADLFTALPTVALNAKLADLAGKAGFNGLAFNLTPSQYVSLLQAQEAIKLAIDRGFLAVLKQVGLDYNDPSSPYHGQYARAYQAIATLFPASLGYTDNSAGGSGIKPALSHTGDLRMARSLVETQTGGDISLLGPGGNAYVGSNSADQLTPAQEGILTLAGGSIRTYTDESVLIYQSRVFTEQGGNIEMFSANGDLNAGKGPKSSAAYPPLKLICDADGYCRVNPTGLVTGAGIGALLSVPGQDPSLSNVILTAPHGTIDAGAAGIRVAGSGTFTALQILNAFNIQVQGATVGIPVTQGPPVGALTASNNTAGAAAKTADTPKQNNDDRPSVIIVEFLGFGGSDGNPVQEQDNNGERGKARERQGYNPNSAVQFVEFGEAK